MEHVPWLHMLLQCRYGLNVLPGLMEYVNTEISYSRKKTLEEDASSLT